MAIRLKPIEEQVIVITGASSGIGLTTARMAAARGARVVIASRDNDALATIEQQIREQGGKAIHVMADVGSEDEIRAIADAAIQSFGGFDTWVNNAGVSIYGRIDQVSMEDHRRLFETNYWGVVQGSCVALEQLRDRGGAIINIGSVASDRALPLQGAYSASKHAVKAFTDALRMELEADGAPVSITLIKPGSVDTEFERHARNYMDTEPNLPPPVYAPELVAKAILHAAQYAVRDLYVGGGGRVISLSGQMAPRLTDRMMELVMTRAQRGGPRQDHGDSLHRPSGAEGHERGHRHGFVREHSLYTTAELHPWMTAAAAMGLGALAYMAVSGTGGMTRHDENRRIADDDGARRRYAQAAE
ncbi:MAG TPA: SDR family oxidoreductase [Azospirillaceae bacterium]|nr:SDR family oxidoreductase [Azospirillaceae bacterium]